MLGRQFYLQKNFTESLRVRLCACSVKLYFRRSTVPVNSSLSSLRFWASNTEFTESAEKKFRMEHRCPICKVETDSQLHKDFPFCSERCRMQDLGNWASEKYVVSDPIFDEEEAAEGERKTILLDLEKPDDTGS